MRQLSFDFFAQHPPLEVTQAKTEQARVAVPVPTVLIGEPVPMPEKVRNVFDLYFDGEPAVQTVIKKEERKFAPTDYPDVGMSNFEWTDGEIIELHISLLDYYTGSLLNTRSILGEKAKLEVLTWIYGEPEIQGYKWKCIDGKQTKFAILTKYIPFTFYCACHLAGADADVIKKSVQCHLAKRGELGLLDQI
ncbi:hypothetical protein KXJ72_17795 (plasmid) [Comamonas aquatica]|nr:hypothetical protein KXJ72_17795 [Comamonas aquatica]